MVSYKDFDIMIGEDRPEFVVGGQNFTARAKLPWKKFSRLILSMSGDDVTSQEGLDKTEEFFRLVLIPADRDRFIELINSDGDEDDDVSVVSSEQVSSLLDWLLVFYTGKAQESDETSLISSPDSGPTLNSNSASLDPVL